MNWRPLESHPEKSSRTLLQVPVSRLKSYGDCAFSVAGPTLWNRLPADIRNVMSFENFKSLLKTLNSKNSEGNEVKSKMKHPSDIPTPRFEHGC